MAGLGHPGAGELGRIASPGARLGQNNLTPRGARPSVARTNLRPPKPHAHRDHPAPKVRIEAANRFYYPDVMVCCGPVEAEPDIDYETAPQLIVEVLSPSTAANDDGEKRINYQTLASLNEYLLLDPTSGAATLYRRGGSFWTRIQLDRHDQLELESVGLSGEMQWLLGEPARAAQ